MLWRHLCLVRAWSAAGLLTCSMFGRRRPRAEPEDPLRRPTPSPRPSDPRRRRRPATSPSRSGATARDRVQVTLKNTSTKRLNVVLPPGLVASSASRPGRRRVAAVAAGSRAWASAPSSNRRRRLRPVRRNDANEPGFRSVAVSATAGRAVTVPAGQTVELDDPVGLPQLRPAHPDAQGQVDARRRRRLLARTRASARRSAQPGDPRHEPRHGAGRDVAGLQQRAVRVDGRAGDEGHEPPRGRPGLAVRRGPRRLGSSDWSTRPT